MGVTGENTEMMGWTWPNYKPLNKPNHEKTRKTKLNKTKKKDPDKITVSLILLICSNAATEVVKLPLSYHFNASCIK